MLLVRIELAVTDLDVALLALSSSSSLFTSGSSLAVSSVTPDSNPSLCHKSISNIQHSESVLLVYKYMPITERA